MEGRLTALAEKTCAHLHLCSGLSKLAQSSARRPNDDDSQLRSTARRIFESLSSARNQSAIEVSQYAVHLRGQYNGPPDEVAGQRGASYFELGDAICANLLSGLADAADPKRLENQHIHKKEFDPGLIEKNWPRVRHYLLENAPSFDVDWLTMMVLDEAARADRAFLPAVEQVAAVSVRGDLPDPRLDRERRTITDIVAMYQIARGGFRARVERWRVKESNKQGWERAKEDTTRGGSSYKYQPSHIAHIIVEYQASVPAQ